VRYQRSLKKVSLPDEQVAAGWFGPSVLQPLMSTLANTLSPVNTVAFGAQSLPPAFGVLQV